MPEYDDTNRGAIWPNDRMREGKQDPHFTGSLNADGREFWVSAWKRKPDAKAGSPSLSFTVKAKDEQKAPNPNPPQVPQDDFDDDIPF
jgi:hypothetical protein